jgi:hypothetical protein
MDRMSPKKFLELLEERYPGIRTKIEARYSKTNSPLGKPVVDSRTGKLRFDIRDKQEGVFLLKGVRALGDLEGTTFPFTKRELGLLNNTEIKSGPIFFAFCVHTVFILFVWTMYGP